MALILNQKVSFTIELIPVNLSVHRKWFTNVVDQNSLVKLRSGSRQTAVRHRWRNVNYRFRNFSSRFLRSRVQRAVQVVEEKSAPWGKLQFLPARKHMMSRVDIVYSWSKVRPGGSPGLSREFAIARHERGEKRSSPASTSCDQPIQKLPPLTTLISEQTTCW